MHLPCLVSQEQCSIWSQFLLYLCKMMISPGVFLIFQNFDFSGLQGVKGQKWSKMAKNSVCRTRYLRNHTLYDCHLWYTCVKWYYPHAFLQFFKILIFRVVRGVKGQKWVQNDKKFCSSCSISLEPKIIWLSFMVHMCKMIISPGFFFSFSKFWFFGLSGG